MPSTAYTDVKSNACLCPHDPGENMAYGKYLAKFC